MKNVFESKYQEQSPEMKQKFNELRKLTAEMLLLHCEDKGEEADLTTFGIQLSRAVEFDSVWFRTSAFHKLATQPETPLPANEKIAIAAHEAYKSMVSREL
jgi:hypothetical protein